MSGWAIDLGTTNTGVAIWDDIAGRPRLLELTDICRVPDGEDQLEAPRLVPSATHVLPGDDFWTKVGRWPMMSRNFFMGQQAHIGRTAIEMNKGRITPNFTLMFKPYLGLDPLRILARAGKERFTARDICRIFLRELFANVKKTTGKRIRDLVVTTPVEAFESYRAEITEITSIADALHEVTEPPEDLTPAMIEALRLVGAGVRHTTAAAEIGISESALTARLSSARDKLGVKTTAEALRMAREFRLI